MLAIGTNDGIVAIERSGEEWRIVAKALEGIRIDDVGQFKERTIVATEQGVFESEDNWATWEKTLDNVDARCIGISQDGTVYIGTDGAFVYRKFSVEEEYLELSSFRELPTCWSWTFPVSPHIPNIRSIVVSPSNPKHVYVGVEVGGVMASFDAGESWKEARENIHPDIHGLVAAPGELDQIYAVTGVGFFRSTDSATSWQSSSDGLNDLYTIAITNDPSQPECVYASATAGRPRNWRTRPEGANARVYRSVDGEAWHSVMNEGLVEAVDALEVDSEGLVFAGTHGGEVFALRGHSDEWILAINGLQPINSLTHI
tara:strand:- start:202 stop:1146 length:945 start_codon:yes stop_codon:yes gene_type:complete